MQIKNFHRSMEKKMRYEIEVSASVPLVFRVATKKEAVKQLRKVRSGAHSVMTNLENGMIIEEAGNPKKLAELIALEIEAMTSEKI